MNLVSAMGSEVINPTIGLVLLVLADVTDLARAANALPGTRANDEGLTSDGSFGPADKPLGTISPPLTARRLSVSVTSRFPTSPRYGVVSGAASAVENS